MLTIGSLFSGIGGLELGLERAGLGPVRWQVEIDAGARSVLAAHWPEATRYGDVRTVDGEALAPVDLVCGGFPCQDISSAGSRAGLAGPSSSLWAHFHRVVSVVAPQWIVVENVVSGAGRWLDVIRGDLAELGYGSLPVPLTAFDCGYPHRRARIFVVATYDQSSGVRLERIRRPVGRDTNRSSKTELTDARSPAGATAARRRAEQYRSSASAALGRGVYGVSGGLDAQTSNARIAALGNSVVPQCAEVVGHVIRELMKPPYGRLRTRSAG